MEVVEDDVYQSVVEEVVAAAGAGAAQLECGLDVAAGAGAGAVVGLDGDPQSSQVSSTSEVVVDEVPYKFEPEEVVVLSVFVVDGADAL